MNEEEEWFEQIEESSTASTIFESEKEWTGLYNKKGQKLFPSKSKLGFIKNVSFY